YGPPQDRTLPGRLFLGLKRLLGDPHTERLSVFDRNYRLVALLTPILLHIRDALARDLPLPLPALHAGRPVTFEGRAGNRDDVAVARLSEAYAHAGLAVAQFYPEPVAATLACLPGRRLPGRATPMGGGL